MGVEAGTEGQGKWCWTWGVWVGTEEQGRWGGPGAGGVWWRRPLRLGGAEGGCFVADPVPIGSQANSSSSAFRSANGHLTREFSRVPMAAQSVGNLIGYVCRRVALGGRLRAALPRRRQPIGSLWLRHWLRRLRPELRASPCLQPVSPSVF